MSWDAKKSNGPYFYKSVREGGRVHKVYVGRGERAEEEARKVEERRETRQAQREARHAELAQIAGAEGLLNEAKPVADLLTRATLYAAGYYQHHGQWRRRRASQGGQDDGPGSCKS
jgi:hypothetical protein